MIVLTGNKALLEMLRVEGVKYNYVYCVNDFYRKVVLFIKKH